MAAAAPDPDSTLANTGSTEPPIWAERKPSEHHAAGRSSLRRVAGLSANALALRQNGYAALERRRYGEALTLLQESTSMGDAYAPMYIGELFESGIGVPRDVGQASYWYGIAISRGNALALAAFNRMRVSPY